MQTKILMVCLGNICRSPIAEGVLFSKLPEDKFIVTSAGTGNWHVDQQPDLRSIAVSKKNGIDISNQKCQQFQTSDFETFDYIYVMDSNNYNDVIKLAKNENQKKKVRFNSKRIVPQRKQKCARPLFWFREWLRIGLQNA